VSRDHIEKGLDRLRDLYREAGYLTATIGPIEWTTTRKGVELAVPIQRGTHYHVEFTGDLGVGERALKAEMTFFDDPRDDEEALADEGDRLTRYLADRGYRRAAVRAERHVEPDDTVLIRVVVDAGPPFPLGEVIIIGNIAAPDAEFQALLATQPSGFWRSRYAERNALEIDRQQILSWYRAHGFLSPNVTARVEDAADPPRATAVFAVEEGPQTRISRVEIQGQGAVPLDPILQRLEVQEGSPYVEVRLRAARTALLEAYSELGHVYATVEVSSTISPDRTRADVKIRIVEGLAVKVGEITLTGNERTKDHVILRELTLKPGDPYNPQRIFENQRQVAQLGFLREVRLVPTDPEREEPVKDLRLSVKERDAGIVDLGVGYSNYEGMRGFGEITYRNLMGLGRRASLRLEGSRIERKSILSYRHPWLFDRRIDGKAALFHEVREEETRNYQRSTYGVSFGVDRTLRPRLFGSLVYDYQINDLEALDPNTPPDLLPFDEDRSNIGSLTPSLVWNSRDDLFNPRTGVLATVAFESAALLLGSQEQFWKVTAGTSRFIPLAKPLVLALGTRAGVASRFGETREALIQEAPPGTDVRIPLLLPPTERFYVGGRSSIRGYEEDTVGPKLDDGTPTGGNVFLLLNAELRATVVGSLGVVVFWDGGNAWLDQDDIRWTDIKTTVGLGLRYNTPVGPLRLDYGFKLNRDPRPPDPDGVGPQEQPPQEDPGAFHFTLGHAF
jgi:outer membrane protein insertion porin family